jgi:hypothetical protein
MARIGEALNVTERTIGRDLSNSDTRSELNHAKTATNPKGSGQTQGQHFIKQLKIRRQVDTRARKIREQ